MKKVLPGMEDLRILDTILKEKNWLVAATSKRKRLIRASYGAHLGRSEAYRFLDCGRYSTGNGTS